MFHAKEEKKGIDRCIRPDEIRVCPGHNRNLQTWEEKRIEITTRKMKGTDDLDLEQ